VYSHKTHEKCADILLSRLSQIKLGQIILSAITTGGFIAAVLGAGTIGALIGVIVSTTLLVLNAYTKNYDLGELPQKHRQAGADLWIIREKYLS
jgi:sorbitol-specific phosphotransferase system component IIBC